jgi:Na+/H+-dicarboxylate symporter
MVIGVLIGHFYPEFGTKLQILSDIFLRLIKMIIAPLVLATLIVGVAKVGDFRSVGRIGIKTLIYFQLATAMALFLGLLLVNTFEPGTNMDISTTFQQGAETGIKATKTDFKSFISHVIPTSVVDAMARNEILPIVIFSLFFGIATAGMQEKGKIIIDFFDAVSHVMFKVTNYVMQFAPFGVLGAISAVIAKQGIGILSGYAYLIACFYGGLITFGFIILGIVCLALRINFLRLLSFIKEPCILAFSTASSESAFPKTIEALERYGCGNRIISFVLPLGYSFNMDGSIMYMTFATVFIAQAYGIELSVSQQITMMLILLVTSKGMAGVPRASLVVIAGTLVTFNIPQEGLLLLLGIDQILDMGRSAINVIGNAVATAVISKWENELQPVKKDVDIDKVALD